MGRLRVGRRRGARRREEGGRCGIVERSSSGGFSDKQTDVL